MPHLKSWRQMLRRLWRRLARMFLLVPGLAVMVRAMQGYLRHQGATQAVFLYASAATLIFGAEVNAVLCKRRPATGAGPGVAPAAEDAAGNAAMPAASSRSGTGASLPTTQR